MDSSHDDITRKKQPELLLLYVARNTLRTFRRDLGIHFDTLNYLNTNVGVLDCYPDIERPEDFVFAVSPTGNYSFLMRGRREDFIKIQPQPDIIVTYWDPIGYRGYPRPSAANIERLDILKNIKWI